MRPAERLAWLALVLAAGPAAAEEPRANGESVIAEINLVRADPQAYAAELRAYRRLYQGKAVIFPDREQGLATQEGVAAVDEAIRFLERQTPLPPLAESATFTGSARDHARDHGRSGGLGHRGSDGSTPGQRVQRRGGGIYVTESVTYGPAGAMDVVRQLIIDDGVKGRGHRKMLFAPRWQYAGAACGPHPAYRWMCVVDLGETADGAAGAAKAAGERAE